MGTVEGIVYGLLFCGGTWKQVTQGGSILFQYPIQRRQGHWKTPMGLRVGQNI